MENKLIDDEATIWKTNSLIMRQLYENIFIDDKATTWKQTHWWWGNYNDY